MNGRLFMNDHQRLGRYGGYRRDRLRSDRRPIGAPTSSSSNNMLETESYVYDGGASGGDGLLTESIAYVDASTERGTLYGNDWRDRQLWTMVYDGARYTFTFNTYDNLDDVTDVTRYYDESGVPGLAENAPNSGDPIIGRSGAAFDSLGREYQTISLQFSWLAGPRPIALDTSYA